MGASQVWGPGQGPLACGRKGVRSWAPPPPPPPPGLCPLDPITFQRPHLIPSPGQAPKQSTCDADRRLSPVSQEPDQWQQVPDVTPMPGQVGVWSWSIHQLIGNEDPQGRWVEHGQTPTGASSYTDTRTCV